MSVVYNIYFLTEKLKIKIDKFNFGKLPKDSNEDRYAYLMRKDKNNKMGIYVKIDSKDVEEFLKKHENCIIFISVDNRQYSAFRKMINIVDGKNVIVKQESEIIRGTSEYQTSLVLDNLLNIERVKE